ncbi:YaeQ family protein [Neopusillimonas maritima]|jgi:uncharacterized protein YaeQ|uniref:YaeQ family protein n=1 Tax=Neopusillimonas maritima TaxID=2026239 RepID=A0A3A1YWZ8_9BURK|nr:YaeQ family protein [Neopusillimonas maritima]RIY41360.1 hypothetical protein CJP73_07470 [Neopusillimonas maritima]
MALRATIYKADLHIADNDRAYYASHSVTVARHPSETDERMMVRLLAFALYVDDSESLVFTKGLSETDEPDLWRLDLTGAITQWIETGLPDERRILKACGRANEVVVIAYGRNAQLWWDNVKSKLSRAQNLQVFCVDVEGTQALAALAARKMVLNINTTDDTAWVSSEQGEASVMVSRLA